VIVMLVGSRIIEMVKSFTYLGSNLLVHCETACEVKCQIAKAPKAFGSLRTPNCHHSINTKRAVYNAIDIPWCRDLDTKGPWCVYVDCFS